jgi:hypothetical protein
MSGILANIYAEHGVRILSRLSKRRLDGVGGTPGWFQSSGEFGIQLCGFTPLIKSLHNCAETILEHGGSLSHVRGPDQCSRLTRLR